MATLQPQVAEKFLTKLAEAGTLSRNGSRNSHIEELQGIRKRGLSLGQKTFAISGPNGSGKSGVIDAIEFGLSGQIGRLTGRGTQGLTVSEH